MVCLGDMHKLLTIVAIIAACFNSARAGDFSLQSAGARFGFSSSDSVDFHQVDLLANWNLPWKWELGSHLRLKTRLDLSAGWLGDPGGNAVVGAFGPSLVFGHQRLPLSVDVGVSPTLISESEFQTKDLGSHFQFTSHVGLNWDFAAHFRFTYRFQHMSNADIALPNPGLNQHMLGVNYVF